MSTERLDLRPLAPGDADQFHLIWGDPEVIWWGQASPHRRASRRALASLMERIESMPPGMGWAWLVERETGAVVGDVVLQPAPDPPGGVEIGWHLAREHWGRGYATEGAAPLIPHAWSLGVEELIAMIVPINGRSVRVAERLGMVRRGPTVPRGNLAHGIWVIAAPGPKDSGPRPTS